MVVKVSRKAISAKINDSLLEALWEDAKTKCKHESNFELDIEVLIDWFQFNVVENHPQTQKKRVVGGETKEGFKKEKDKDVAPIDEAPIDEAPINEAPTKTRTEIRTEIRTEAPKEVPPANTSPPTPPNESGAATTAVATSPAATSNKAQGNREDETNDSIQAK